MLTMPSLLLDACCLVPRFVDLAGQAVNVDTQLLFTLLLSRLLLSLRILLLRLKVLHRMRHAFDATAAGRA